MLRHKEVFILLPAQGGQAAPRVADGGEAGMLCSIPLNSVVHQELSSYYSLSVYVIDVFLCPVCLLPCAVQGRSEWRLMVGNKQLE